MQILKKRQVAFLLFIIATSFKFAMLPSYVSTYAKNQGWIVIAITLVVDVLLFLFIYFVMCKGGIDALKLPKWIFKILMVILVAYFFFKSVNYFSEAVSYISKHLFERGEWRAIIIIGFATLFYIVLKGMKIIGRLADFFIWAIVLITVFDVLFSSAQVKWDKILPFMPDGVKPIFTAMDKHYLWYGNFLPFLFVKVEKQDKNNYIIPIFLAISYAACVLFYLVFYGIYGSIAMEISNAFTRLAVLNTLSGDLGNLDWPTIIIWLVSSGLVICLHLYAGGFCVNKLIGLEGKKSAGKLIFGVTFVLATFFFVKNLEVSYRLATSYIRYFVLAVQICIPLLLGVLACVQMAIEKGRKPGQSLGNEVQI